MRGGAIVAALTLMAVGLAGCAGPDFTWPDVAPATCDLATDAGFSCQSVFSNDAGSNSQVVFHDAAMYVVSQAGIIWRVQGGTAEVFMDLRDDVATCHFEQGALGLAFDPGRSDTVYVTFTEDKPCDKRGTYGKGDLLLYRAAFDAGGVSGDSRELLLRIPEPYRNHNGGHIAFGPDGYLYLGVGDGGDHGDPLETGDDPSDMLGSILRLDVSGGEAVGAPGNPFEAGGGDARVLHYGLRNPWRFDWGPDGSMWIADVGQACFEEVNHLPPGATGLDLGWSGREGNAPYTGADEGCPGSTPTPDGLTDPVWTYDHASGHCSITGGPVLGEQAWAVAAGLAGAYVASDFCSGRIWAIWDDAGKVQVDTVLDTGLQVTAMAAGPDGLYVSSWEGSVHRFVPL